MKKWRWWRWTGGAENLFDLSREELRNFKQFVKHAEATEHE